MHTQFLWSSKVEGSWAEAVKNLNIYFKRSEFRPLTQVQLFKKLWQKKNREAEKGFPAHLHSFIEKVKSDDPIGTITCLFLLKIRKKKPTNFHFYILFFVFSFNPIAHFKIPLYLSFEHLTSCKTVCPTNWLWFFMFKPFSTTKGETAPKHKYSFRD